MSFDQLTLIPGIIVLLTWGLFDVVGGTFKESTRWRFIVATRIPLRLLVALGFTFSLGAAATKHHWWTAAFAAFAILSTLKSLYDPPPEPPKRRSPRHFA